MVNLFKKQNKNESKIHAQAFFSILSKKELIQHNKPLICHVKMHEYQQTHPRKHSIPVNRPYIELNRQPTLPFGIYLNMKMTYM